MYHFKCANAVWGENLNDEYNQFLGFHTVIEANVKTKIHIAIAARSYYRLYLNGEMKCSGPARTAVHYCRVDEIEAEISGKVNVAVEVAALSKPTKYCNDCTMEPGLFVAEITDMEGQVLAATGNENPALDNGKSGWFYKKLAARRSRVETMSHSRGILEFYDLDMHSFDWRYGLGEAWNRPVPASEQVTWLKRRAPYPDYHKIHMEAFVQINDLEPTEGAGAGFVLGLARAFNEDWYASLPEENCFLESLRNEKETVFTGKFIRLPDQSLKILPGKYPAACQWARESSEVGFIDFDITVEEPCIVDIINSDHRHHTGALKANSYVTVYSLQPGTYHLTSFEPKLTRYIKMIFRTRGQVIVSKPQLLDDTFPDRYDGWFSCDDEDMNRIYAASRRTLRLNTLDIFMDCPQRERGGWLCDSHFSAYGAWQMFGDLSVEKDFIENFMLTDPDVMKNAFFPEVYPSVKRSAEEVGIENWSFWLLTELYDYYQRSGDRAFIEQCRERVSRFVTGLLSLRKESGLLEGFDSLFVDWSLSNRSFCLEPISVPNNCLAVYLLERMAELYNRPDWKEEADQMRAIIERLDKNTGIFGGGGDSASYKNGTLVRGECLTESGVALELWSGFHKDDRAYIQQFVQTMGPCPKYRANPNIGKANLFIGLMLRFDVLARMDKIETLVKEWKEVYLDELSVGSGTFFENYNALSGCHGFNGATGALMTNKVLGLGQPMQGTKTVKINPHPCHLKWANGSAKCEDGHIFLQWSADHENHLLDMMLQMPKGWTYELDLPFELCGWTVILNEEKVSL